MALYRARLKRFCQIFNARERASLTPLEIDEHLAEAGRGMSDSTRHHDAVAAGWPAVDSTSPPLSKGGLGGSGELVPRVPRSVFVKLEKPRVGQRDRVPTAAETEAILAGASPEFRLIYLALRQCGARPGELCRATIADIDRTANAIIRRDHKTARKTVKPRRL